MQAELNEFDSRQSLRKKYSQWWFYPWLIWGLGAAFFFSEYLGRVAPSVVKPELIHAFNIDSVQFGLIGSIFLAPYIIMQMPVGMLVDRYGPHKLLTVTCATSALGCFLFGIADHFVVAEIGRFLLGFSAAFAFVGALKLATLWFCPTRFGLLAGLTQALGMFGAALGVGPLTIVVEHLGWRESMFIITGILALLTVAIGLIVRDHPEDHEHDKQPSEQLSAKIHFWDALKTVLKNPQSWINGLFVGCVYAPTGVFGELWGPDYLMTTYGLSRTVAGQAVMMVFLGWVIGGPLAGMISDAVKRRTPVMLASAIMSLVMMLVILYVPNQPVAVLYLTLFLFGLANTGVGVSYAVAGEINVRRVAGTSLAFANMASILVAFALDPIVGWILKINATLSNGTYVYDASAYHYAMISLPICLAVGVISVFFVRETHCKITEE